MHYNKDTRGFYDENPPKGSVEITIEEWQKLINSQNEGFVIVPDEKGYPVSVKPVLSEEQIVEQNETIKSELINEATLNINMLQDELDLDMSDDVDKTSELLKKWKKYRVLLSRVDASISEVIFPERPDFF